MSLWGAFTGSDAKKQARETYEQNSQQMQAGYDNSNRYQNEGYSAAVNRLSPYATQGQAGNNAYANILGINGAGAQADAQGAYRGFNPYLGGSMNLAQKASDRRSAAMGQVNSGMNALASNRVATQMGSDDFYKYVAGLQGLGQQGFQASNALAGIDTNNAAQRIAIENALRSGNVQNQTQLGNSLTQANSAFLNNIISLGSAMGQMAFGMPPTALKGINGGQQTGQVPIGQSGYNEPQNNWLSNFGNWFRGGLNSA